tara:strand:+ start:604 stop:1740 length:1137 start_codon:yes stop_codon:yes gene_type:complete
MIQIILAVLSSSILFGQSECDGERYSTEIFNDVIVTSNVLYGGNYNPNIWGQNLWEDLYLDIYEPLGDNIENRPLIFFLFGGSFVAGSKTNSDIVELCTRYAKMGYVASAIDYRLTGDLIWFPNAETAYRATAKGMHDLKGAIRWFRMNDEIFNEYRIDSDRIYAGGISAGAIVAVNTAYLDENNEVPGSIIDYINENGGLEGDSGNPGYDSHLHGIVNLCGAVGDYNWILEGDIPIVSVHGDEDTIVPYGDGLITLFGLNMQVYGSYVINETMHSLGNNSALYTFYGYDHNPFTGSAQAMNITIDFTRNFMEGLVCPNNEGMLGDLNADSILNVQDIIIMVNIILDIVEYNEFADINDDSIVNVLDVIQLMNLILDN